MRVTERQDLTTYDVVVGQVALAARIEEMAETYDVVVVRSLGKPHDETREWGSTR